MADFSLSVCPRVARHWMLQEMVTTLIPMASRRGYLPILVLFNSVYSLSNPVSESQFVTHLSRKHLYCLPFFLSLFLSKSSSVKKKKVAFI